MAKPSRLACIQPATWLHRTESATGKNGTRLTIHYRRRVESLDGDRLRLGGIERTETPEGEAPTDWQPWGGILGMGANATTERFSARGYRPGQRPDKAGRKQR
jgi:hypothetical protein